MNREQAREIARRASHDWEFPQGVETRSEAEAVADALHAAYEAERAESEKDTKALEDGLVECAAAARLASIKETARATWVSNQCSGLKDALDGAERFETEFERRYGGKP